jgi:hypothetical protein
LPFAYLPLRILTYLGQAARSPHFITHPID